MNIVARQYRDYIKQHRTRGCRYSHMFGVPLTAIALFSCFFRPMAGLLFVAAAYSFQLIGHLVFEGNRPFLITTGDAKIIGLAFVMVVRDWRRLLRRRFAYTGDFRRKQELKTKAQMDSKLQMVRRSRKAV